MSGRPLYRSELIGAAPVGLVTVTYAGRVFRFSTQPVTIDTDDGDTYQYDGGISGLDLDAALAEAASEPEYPTVPVSLLFPVDVAALVEQGHDLSLAEAEVAVHVPGQTWEQRGRLVVGKLTQPVYGEDGEPVDASVEQAGPSDGGVFPPIEAIVSEDTWPNAPTDSKGQVYPWVFGAPGRYISASGSALTTSGSPAIIVDVDGSGDADTLLICDGHVDASSVIVFDSTDNESLSVTNTTDSLGRKVATVDVSTGVATVIDRTQDEFWIGWNNGGGAQNDDRTDALTGAGEIMEAVLRRATVDIDRGRWHSVAGTLNSYVLAGYIDTHVTPWEWVADNVLPLLPVALVGGPGGIYPSTWNMEATAQDAVEALQDGRNCVRVSRVTYVTTAKEQYESASLQFAPRAKKAGEYRRSILLRSTTTDESTESHSAYLSRRGVLRGAEASRAETTDVVYDAPTAARIVSGWLRAALPVRTFDVEGGASLGWLTPGQVVTYTETALHLSGQVARVAEMTWLSMSAVRLTLEVRASPSRDARYLP